MITCKTSCPNHSSLLPRSPDTAPTCRCVTALPGSPSLPTDHVRVVRLGVIVSMFRDGHMDWFHSELLRGLDDAADEYALSIELLGHKSNDLRALGKRLMQERHDLIVRTTHSWPELMVLAEPRRQAIACLDAGSRSPEWHIPNVFEDSSQGAELAVRHLLELGHHRIGFVQLEEPAHWAFDRRRGYLHAMEMGSVCILLQLFGSMCSKFASGGRRRC